MSKELLLDFSKILLETPACVAITTGKDHTFLIANKPYLEAIGRENVEEIIKKDFSEVIQSKDLVSILDSVYTSGKSIKKEFISTNTKNGEINYFNFTYKALSNDNEEIIGILIHGIEVTAQVEEKQRTDELTEELEAERQTLVNEINKRLHTEKELHERTASIKFLSDSLPQLIWTANSYGEHDYFNKRWYEYTGLSFTTTSNQSWSDVIHPEDKKHAIEAWQKAIKSGKLYEVEYRYKKYDNTYRWFIGRALPMCNENGEVTKWFGTCTDIHDQKLASERANFLGEATKIISSTLNYEETLNSIAQIIVPELADWYSVSLIESDGSITNAAVAHRDPEKIKWAKSLNEKYPIDKNALTGVPHVIRTGKSEFFPYISDELLASTTDDKEYLEIMKKIGFTSVIIVPLTSRNKTFGALTLVTAESRRFYTEDDLNFAEELASRIAVAIDNSVLFHDAEKEIIQMHKAEQ
jgi:PAS domain S-box-containing protein